MSGERHDNLDDEGRKNQTTLEERLKALEDQNKSLSSNNDRLLSESQKYKKQARDLETLKSQEEADKKIADDDKLREQGQYKQLMEQREERIKNLELEIESEKKVAREASETLIDAKKLSAFQSRLGGQLKNDDYLAFVNTDGIVVIDGKVDVSSVDTAVKNFLSKYEDLVNFGASRMPNGQGGHKKSKISQKQWASSCNKSTIDNFEEVYSSNQR